MTQRNARRRDRAQLLRDLRRPVVQDVSYRTELDEHVRLITAARAQGRIHRGHPSGRYPDTDPLTADSPPATAA